MIKNFIRRANYVAWVYFWTFSVTFFANQYLFFGLCLSIACIAAALPPVGIFSVAVGSLVNHVLGWGQRSKKDSEVDRTGPPERTASIETRSAPLLHSLTKKLDTFNEGLEGYNVRFEKRSQNFNLKLAVHVGLDRFHCEQKIVQKLMETAEELSADPALADIFYEVAASWDEDNSGLVKTPTNEEPLAIADYSFPEKYRDASDAEELRARIEDVKIKHASFLKMIHDKLVQDSALRHHFEKQMKPKYARIFEQIMQLDSQGKAEDPQRVIKPAQERLIVQIKPRKVVVPRPMAPVTRRRVQSNRTLGHTLPVSGYDIEEFTAEIGLPHLVHFTRCENLRSILHHGLQSVAQCESLDLNAICNDELRLDGRLDGTSLSIAFPNYKMFYKYRQISPNSEWAVLLLSPRVLWEKKCRFYPHNAADARSRHYHAQKANSLPNLKEVFSVTSGERPEFLKAYDPTDPQAEVMVFEGIEPSYIETISFETEQSANRWRLTVDGRDVIYAGAGKGLFGTRHRVRMN